MKRARDAWSMTIGAVLALGACGKKNDGPAPSASVASAPTVIAPLVASSPPAAVDSGAGSTAPALGNVKRFPEREKVATGAVQVLVDGSKVYDEPDLATPSVTTLSKDLFVVRLATLGTDWVLVNFPAGIGKLSPGWIEAKSLARPAVAATKAPAAGQSSATAVASAKPVASAAPAVSAVASVTPAPAASVVVRKPGAILKPPR